MSVKKRKGKSEPKETDGWHQYRLKYHANASGRAKSIEFRAEDITQALQFAMDDPARRTIEIWEDEHYACRFSRDRPANQEALACAKDPVEIVAAEADRGEAGQPIAGRSSLVTH